VPLVDYTSNDDIRAALGVSDDELDDATLSLSVYEYQLIAELEEADPSVDLIAAYGTVAAVVLGSRTHAQQRFYQSLRQFATYSVAKHLTSSLPLFSPKEQGEGKATLSRYSADPYKETTKQVLALHEKAKQRALAAYKTMSSVTANAVAVQFYAGSVSPGYDPVTG
jgi:hypothetical protein